jgi:hypothetical protein
MSEVESLSRTSPESDIAGLGIAEMRCRTGHRRAGLWALNLQAKSLRGEMVEAAGVELVTTLITRKLLIL